MKKLKVLSMVLVLVMALAVVSDASTVAAPATAKAYAGQAQIPTFRVGPGKDAKGVQVYSFTVTTVNAIFDANGRIIDVYYDGLEVSTPNYDGASMPHFSGWPATPGYNVSEHKGDDSKVIGKSTNNDTTIAAEVNAWKTKRERGDSYGMNPANDWYKQINFYQNFFKGKTIAEIETWAAKNLSDVNGRPLKITEKSKPEDVAKYGKLTVEEKAALADVVSGATMSLKDAHGDFIGALKKAYENRREIGIPVQVSVQ